MKKLNRRDFVALTALAATSFACHGCMNKKQDNEQNHETDNEKSVHVKTDPNKGMNREEILAMLDQRADNYIRQGGNCAQASFKALSEQFGLESKDILKALTPMPGIAEMGKTCGVITGSLMVMGLIYGRDNLDDWKKYRDSLVPAGKFVSSFEKELGSSLCSDIVEKEFGKRLDLRNPPDHAEFVKEDPGTRCGAVVKKGVNIAAGIILNDQGKG